MLCPLGEKPPAEMVESALQIESNTGMPVIINPIISIKVKPRYNFHKIEAVFLTLGVNLSSVGPGASAKNICRPATANCGRIAINITIIPIPPNHWVKLRQKKKALG